MFNNLRSNLFGQLLILSFLVTQQVHAQNSIVPTRSSQMVAPNFLIADVLGLATQQVLYHKYFMDNTRAIDEGVWNDFLAQPHGVSLSQRSNGVVTSLISHPSCIATAWLSIESLMRQEVLPDRIILNLYESEFPDKTLPWTLQQQTKRGLEINWVPAGTTINSTFTRSDVLHPSRLIQYFSTHALNELVIIPYKVHLPIASQNNERSNFRLSDALAFEDAFSQFELLGGTLKYLPTERFPTNHVHNPSLIRFNNNTYMTLRIQHGKRGITYYSETFFAEVDRDYNLKNSYRLVEDRERSHEDARLVIRDGKLCVSYVSDVSDHMRKGDYCHCIEIADFEPGQQIKAAIRPAIENNNAYNCNQKNWLFFEKDGLFLAINNIDPLEVWDCTHSLEAPTPLCKKTTVIEDWSYGHIRASTTPIYLEEYGLWLVFFHSFLETYEFKRIYFLGALTFDNNFNITGYTEAPIFVATPHVKKFIDSCTILPYGCIRENDDLILSLGINDSKAAIGTLPLARVMELLKPV